MTKRGDSTDCTGNHDVMAGQVRPGMAEPVSSWALRVRHNDQAPFSKFHQGPRRRPHQKSGCMAAIVTFLTSRNERLANRGRPCMTGRRIDIAGRTAGVLAGGLRPPARTYASRGLLALASLSMARSMDRARAYTSATAATWVCAEKRVASCARPARPSAATRS